LPQFVPDFDHKHKSQTDLHYDMTNELLELETLVSMAALESHARLSDVQVLQVVAKTWLDSSAWCVTAARFVLGAGDIPVARVSQVPLEVVIDVVLNLLVFEGLKIQTTNRLIQVTHDLLSKLEDRRRLRLEHSELDLTVFALVEAVKAVMFGRNLNIAERSGLRGLYQRERLLQQI
jgi:hypothetical protein